MTAHIGTSKKSGGLKHVLWADTLPFIEMMMSSKCFPHMSKMQILKYNWLSSIVTG
jgi:hypothetical protein